MKKLLLALFIFAFAVPSYAFNPLQVCTGAVASGGYCDDSELFCYTFSGDDDPSWDQTADTYDCDGYDADGDYCDDDTTTYKVSESVGVRGNYTKYMGEALSTTTGELYVTGWFYATDVGSIDWLALEDATNSTHIFRIKTNSSGYLIVDTGNSVDTVTAANNAVTSSAWFWIGVYYKEGTGDPTGTVGIWMNTTGDNFSDGDREVYETDVSTLTTDIGHVRLRGPKTNQTAYWEKLKIIAGEPSWPKP